MFDKYKLYILRSSKLTAKTGYFSHNEENSETGTIFISESVSVSKQEFYVLQEFMKLFFPEHKIRSVLILFIMNPVISIYNFAKYIPMLFVRVFNLLKKAFNYCK